MIENLPQIFNRIQVEWVRGPLILLQECMKVVWKPVWVHFCTFCRSTMLNEDQFRLPPKNLMFSCKPRSPCYFLCWLKFSVQDIVNVILGINSSSLGHHVQICEPVHTHYPPYHDKGTELELFTWLHIFPWLSVNPVILAVWGLKEMYWTVIGEYPIVPVLFCSMLVSFGKCKPFPFLKFCQTWRFCSLLGLTFEIYVNLL